MSRTLWATVALVVVTLLWGTTFVVVKDSLDAMPWMLLLALRFSFGALALAPAGLDRKTTIAGGKLGLLLLLGFGTQTIGLATTGAARAAFITGLSVIMVPWAASKLLRQKVPMPVWVASAVALVGLALLCFDPVQAEFVDGSQLLEICLTATACVEISPPNMGDFWVFVCAIGWTWYFLALEKPAQNLARTPRGAARLTLAQVLTVAVIAWILSIPQLPVLAQLDAKSWAAMIYLGLAATALTTLLQVFGQRIVAPSQAAVVYTLEPLFAALFAWWLLGETMGPVGWVGGVLLMAAMLGVQWGVRAQGAEDLTEG